MNEQEHQELIEAVKAEVQNRIDERFNVLEEAIEQLAQKVEKLLPVAEAFETWSGFRKGMTAIFLPIGTVIGLGSGIALIWTALKSR